MVLLILLICLKCLEIFEKTLFSQELAIVCSLFTLDRVYYVFWIEFDLIFAQVPLKVARGYFQNVINMTHTSLFVSFNEFVTKPSLLRMEIY